MVRLDPSHELPPRPELPDLPLPHHRPGWSWLLALALASGGTFALTAALLAVGMSFYTVAVIAPVVFVLSVFIAHAAADSAR